MGMQVEMRNAMGVGVDVVMEIDFDKKQLTLPSGDIIPAHKVFSIFTLISRPALTADE